MKKIVCFGPILMFLLLSGCQQETAAESLQTSAESSSHASSSTSEEIQVSTEISQAPLETQTETSSSLIEESNYYSLSINGQEYQLELYDNQTTAELKNLLPLDLEMADLNSNEKYYYLEQNLSTNAQSVGQVSSGDVMLYGNNCLVIFYENFSTSYDYTPLGRIIDGDLSQLRGLGSVSVQINE